MTLVELLSEKLDRVGFLVHAAQRDYDRLARYQPEIATGLKDGWMRQIEQMGLPRPELAYNDAENILWATYERGSEHAEVALVAQQTGLPIATLWADGLVLDSAQTTYRARGRHGRDTNPYASPEAGVTRHGLRDGHLVGHTRRRQRW